MIKMFSRAAALWASFAAILLAVTMPAFPQIPTDAQRSAIRSECRSDYEAHCASIPPGGAASLQCLQKNMSSLAPGCQAAVRAVEAPAAAPKADTAPAAAPKAETAPAAPAPANSAATTMAKPSSAQISAIRSACRSDYPKVCAGVPTGGAPALECLEKNKARVSASCQKAVAAATGGGAAPAAGAAADTAAASPAAAAPAAAPAPALVL